MQSIGLPQSPVLVRKGSGVPKTVSARAWALATLLGFSLFAGVAGYEGAQFLVMNDPKPADVILVLAGGADARPSRALELAAGGYAPRIVVDVPDRSQFYGRSELDLAREWAAKQAVAVEVCPIHGLSTKEEAHDARSCLTAAHARRVLIVTSDFHTRRAFSTLRRELPNYEFAIAAAYDPTQFGIRWWQHREWTKTTFYEWTRLIWWQIVDRWS